jgi:hypothetical protein
MGSGGLEAGFVIPGLIRGQCGRSTNAIPSTVRAESVEAFFASKVCGVPTSRVSARRPTYFLLRRQKKEGKEKATLLSASLLRFRCGGKPAVLVKSGVSLELAFGSDNREP